MIYLIAFVALLGHSALFISAVNRYHGMITSRAVLKALDTIWYVLALGIPLAAGLWFLRNVMRGGDYTQSAWYLPLAGYASVCLVAAGIAAIHRVAYVLTDASTTPRLISNHTELVSLTEALGLRPTQSWLTTGMSRIPGNEILTLSVHRKHLQLDILDPALDGFTITHLSDLHLTGQMSKDFYRAIIDSALQLESDMIVITGDIVENRHCLAWLPELFHRLQAPLGVYYVLGNHEKRINDEASVRAALDSAGMVGVGSRCELIQFRDRPVLVAGTELPWYPPAPDMSAAPDHGDGPQPLRILLSHSPDQLRWAQDHEFDLMFAGHTHGGQVRLPGFGPVLSPSLNGIRHAAGTFDCPPTLLHVSRGLSGTRPLRINCPPEIAQLILHGSEA